MGQNRLEFFLKLFHFSFQGKTQRALELKASLVWTTKRKQTHRRPRTSITLQFQMKDLACKDINIQGKSQAFCSVTGNDATGS